MSSRIFALPDELDWKQAYLAAILEKNPVRITTLVQEAQEKLARRERELLAEGLVPSDEAEAIHDACYMLQALRNSLIYRDSLPTN